MLDAHPARCLYILHRMERIECFGVMSVRAGTASVLEWDCPNFSVVEIASPGFVLLPTTEGVKGKSKEGYKVMIDYNSAKVHIQKSSKLAIAIPETRPWLLSRCY